jgi:DGQHR domain-containing protein
LRGLDVGESIRVEAFRVEQSDYEFYLCVMGSAVLRSVATVSRRGDGEGGYQRVLSAKRMNQVGEYIKGQRATFPGSIVVSLTSDCRFEPGPDASRGILVIPDGDAIAFVIDGQHRLFGFEKADGKEFDLVVSAYIGLPESAQAKVFRDVNSNQKGVNASLIYDLIDLVKDAEFLDERPHELVKALNEEDDSPWLNLVKMIGTGQGIITQAGFIRPLKPLLEDKGGLFASFNEGDQLQILKTYFSAWKALFPEAWGSRKHLLCKTVGVSATLKVLPVVLMHCFTSNGDYSLKAMKKVLKPVSEAVIPQTGMPLDFTSASLPGLSGAKAESFVADLIRNALPAMKAPSIGK